MSQATLNSILTQLPSLNSDELEQVKTAVDQRLNHPADTEGANQAALRELHRRGLIDKVELPRDTRPPFEPINVTGKPVSETIIEERR